MKAFEKIGVEQVKGVIESSKKNVADVDAILKKADAALSSLKASTKSLDLEQFNFTKNFISEFNTARLNLFSARSDLVELSTTTVLLCENILIGIRDWQDEYSEALLKNQFVQLKRLIETSKTTLEKAKGQLISKCLFVVIVWTKKTEIFSRISALASKKRSNQKK